MSALGTGSSGLGEMTLCPVGSSLCTLFPTWGIVDSSKVGEGNRDASETNNWNHIILWDNLSNH